VEIYSIGFTKTTAEHFFGRLKQNGVRRLLDVRLNPGSQLSGFAKGRDLPFFLDRLVGASYEHELLLAPTAELLSAYKRSGTMTWDEYEQRFNSLLEERHIESVLDPAAFEAPTALLCSEDTAVQCHRRLVIEYLGRHWPEVHGRHL
jgi:uncharacterized protein (DUF488 family)